MAIANPGKIEPLHILSSQQAFELEKKADKLATFFAGSTTLTASFENAVKVDFENKLTTANIHFELFGMDGISEELVDTWPEVGSIEGHVGDNKPYDIYWYKTPDGKKEQASFWRLTAQKHPVGVAISKEKQLLEDSTKAGVKNKYTGLPESEVEAKIKDCNTKFTTFLGKMKMAVQLYFNMRRANDEMGAILEVDYDRKVVMGPDGKPKVEDGDVVTEIDRSSPQIMVVSDKARKGVAKRFTIANFNRLNVELAKAAGGTYADFITSNKRGTPDDEQEKIVTDPFKIENPVNFENATIQTLHYINGTKNNTPLFKGLVAFYLADGADDRIQTLFQLEDAIAILTGNKAIKDKHDALTMSTKAPEALAS